MAQEATKAPYRPRVIEADERRPDQLLREGDILSLKNFRYRVLKVIATGSGMANVYKIENESSAQRWLLKEVNLDPSRNDPEIAAQRKALVEEHEILMMINHPRIPRVSSIDRETMFAYIFMDFLEDHESLKDNYDRRADKVMSIWNEEYDKRVRSMSNKALIEAYKEQAKGVLIRKQLARSGGKKLSAALVKNIEAEAEAKATKLVSMRDKKTKLPMVERSVPVQKGSNRYQTVRVPSRNLDKIIQDPGFTKAVSDRCLVEGGEIYNEKGEVVGHKSVFIDPETFAPKMSELCDVFSYLHNFHRRRYDESLGRETSVSTPLVYRDAKLSNIMVSDVNSTMKLIDFGITRNLYKTDAKGNFVLDDNGERVRNTSDGFSTKFYAPPEQLIKGAPLDLRSDIFALGVTMFVMLSLQSASKLWRYTGKPKKPGERPPSAAEYILLEEIYPLPKSEGGKGRPFTYKDIQEMGQVPMNDALAKIIAKCIRKDPNDRYDTIEDLRSALDTYRSQTDQALAEAKKKIRIHRVFAPLAALCLAGSVAAGALDAQQVNNRYDDSVNHAEQMSDIRAFADPIGVKPGSPEAYVRMLETQERKGTFTKEDETRVLGMINPNMSKIQKMDEYGHISYLVGKLYWVNFEDSKEGKILAQPWLEEAEKNGYGDNGLTKVMLDTSNFYKSISYDQSQSQDRGRYKDYLANLHKNREVPMPQNIEIEFYKAYNNFLSSYAYNLKNDGVPYTEVTEDLDYLDNWANHFKGNTAKNADEVKKLSESLNSTRVAVDSVYSE